MIVFVNYINYKGGINNLCIVRDLKGNTARSIKGFKQAIKNLERKLKA